MSDTCRSCQAPVIFVPSAKTGKPMILDAKPEKRVVIGQPVLGVRDDPVTIGASWNLDDGREPQVAKVVKTYMDHHATCPAAAQWKGRTRAGAR